VTRTLGSARAINASTRARVDVEGGAPGQYRGTLRLTADGKVHERHLEADTCEAVASAAALIIALAVEGVLPPPSPPSPPAPERPEPPRARPPLPALKADVGAPWRARLVVSAGALVDTTTLPSVAVGPGVGVGGNLAHGHLRLGLSAQGALFPSLFGGATDATTAGEGGRFGLVEGAVRGCVAYGWTSLEIGPCLAVGADHMSASGRGSSVTLSGSGTWASGQGMALAAWSLTRWLAVDGQIGAEIPFARPTFVVDSLSSQASSAVHRPSAVSARIGLGLELRFF
jgi:hypothetical protein